MRFAPEYVKYVLNENFEDAKRLFLAPLDGHPLRAPGDARRPQRHRLGRRRAPHPRWRSTPSRRTTSSASPTTAPTRICSSTSSALIDGCGDEVAGRLHTARSRNDIDMTMYRMRQRECIARACYDGDARAARQRCSTLAGTHIATRSCAAHTHTQPAQPTHRRALPARRHRAARARRRAAAGGLRQRQPQPARRLRDHRHRLSDRPATSPASCSASTGRPATPTAASRPSTICSRASSARVGAARPAWAASCRTCCCGAPRSSATCGFGDGFVQCSSIMPQKRNPVALEHARAIGSKALGRRRRCRSTVHNTPFGDIVDTEDDLQPLVASTFRDAIRAVRLVAAAMPTAEFDAERLEARAGRGRHHADRARRHAGARPRPAVPRPPRDRRQLVAERRASTARRAVGGARGATMRTCRPAAAVHGGGTARASSAPRTSSRCGRPWAVRRRRRPARAPSRGAARPAPAWLTDAASAAWSRAARATRRAMMATEAQGTSSAPRCADRAPIAATALVTSRHAEALCRHLTLRVCARVRR